MENDKNINDSQKFLKIFEDVIYNYLNNLQIVDDGQTYYLITPILFPWEDNMSQMPALNNDLEVLKRLD